MTNIDIIEMAREAGFQATANPDIIFCLDRDGDCTEELKDFAALVAAAEREACAKVCEKYADVLEPLHPEGVATDYFQSGIKSAFARRKAAAIRARGETK